MTPQRDIFLHIHVSTPAMWLDSEVAHNHSLWVCYTCLSEQLSHIHVCMYVSMYIHVCMYVCLYVCMSVCL